MIAYGEARLSDRTKRNLLDMDHLQTMLGFWLDATSNCVDVGAYRGRVLRMIEERAARGSHHAFEPIPHRAAALRVNYPRVDVHEVAVSDHEGTAAFTIVDSREGFSGISDSLRPLPAPWQRHEVTVRVAALDDVLPDDYVPDFIKIDVEGAELAVLRGAERILESCPVLFMEHGVDRQADTLDIHALLTAAGYTIRDVDGGGPYSAAQMSDTVLGDSIWNWVATRFSSSR